MVRETDQKMDNTNHQRNGSYPEHQIRRKSITQREPQRLPLRAISLAHDKRETVTGSPSTKQVHFSPDVRLPTFPVRTGFSQSPSPRLSSAPIADIRPMEVLAVGKAPARQTTTKSSFLTFSDYLQIGQGYKTCFMPAEGPVDLTNIQLTKEETDDLAVFFRVVDRTAPNLEVSGTFKSICVSCPGRDVCEIIERLAPRHGRVSVVVHCCNGDVGSLGMIPWVLACGKRFWVEIISEQV